MHVIPVTWQSHESDLRRIRQAVFVEEQRTPKALEFDAEDLAAMHILALNSAGVALGCARLLENGLMSRVAVLAEARGKGIAEQLVNALIEAALSQSLTKVFLHAPHEARAFYKKLEFIPTGASFMVAGIKHLTMERALPIPFAASGARKTRIVQSIDRPEPLMKADNRSLSAASDLREFADENTAIEQLLTIIAGARRSLRIYSPTLDHTLFDQPRVVDLVSSFARSAPSSHVDILLRDSQLIVARGHSLAELGRRLDEKMLIRRLPGSIKSEQQSWIVADNNGLWVQSEPEGYRGWSDAWNPLQAERFGRRYTQLWDRSGPDPELRLLRI